MCVDEAQYEEVALSFSHRLASCACSLFYLNENTEQGAAMLSLGDAVGDTSEADEQRLIEEPPPRAEGEKGLPLRLNWIFAAAGGLAHIKAWIAADGRGNERGCNCENRVEQGKRVKTGQRGCSLSRTGMARARAHLQPKEIAFEVRPRTRHEKSYAPCRIIEHEGRNPGV
jgi:hypothetical protein